MKGVVLLLGCLAVISLDVQAGELYRWVDSTGVVHYSDMPPPKSEQAESIRISDSAGLLGNFASICCHPPLDS